MCQSQTWNSGNKQTYAFSSVRPPSDRSSNKPSHMTPILMEQENFGEAETMTFLTCSCVQICLTKHTQISHDDALSMVSYFLEYRHLGKKQ